MKIDDIRIASSEINEETWRILKYFLRKNELKYFLSGESLSDSFINFIPNYLSDISDERKRERKLITFDDFVSIFNVDTNPEVEYEYIYEVDDKDKSIVRKKVKI